MNNGYVSLVSWQRTIRSSGSSGSSGLNLRFDAFMCSPVTTCRVYWSTKARPSACFILLLFFCRTLVQYELVLESFRICYAQLTLFPAQIVVVPCSSNFSQHWLKSWLQDKDVARNGRTQGFCWSQTSCKDFSPWSFHTVLTEQLVCQDLMRWLDGPSCFIPLSLSAHSQEILRTELTAWHSGKGLPLLPSPFLPEANLFLTLFVFHPHTLSLT